MSNAPYIIDFPKIGETAEGFISVAEKDSLPFVPKRVYWTYYTPQDVVRGRHSHHELQQILIAVAGTITVWTEMANGDKAEFVLISPQHGLLLPAGCWHTMQYSENAVQVCIASMEYAEEDYIRDYQDFLKLAQFKNSAE